MILILSLQVQEKKIPNASAQFEYFANKSDFVMEIKSLSTNELKDAFYSLKCNKRPGYDDDVKK